MDYADFLLKSGTSRADVVEELVATFGMSVRAADAYIARVRKRWEQESKGTREVEREAALARLDRLSGKAERRGQFGAAVSAEKLRAQVTGILAPKSVDVAVEVAQVPAEDEDLSEQQMMEELAGLAAVLTSAMRRQSLEPSPQLVGALRALAREVEAMERGRLSSPQKPSPRASAH